MPRGGGSRGHRWVAGPEAAISLTGVPVVISSSAHWLRRLLWTLTLVVALYWLIAQLRDSVQRLLHQSLSTTSRTTNRLHLPFPAVTLCAGERFKSEDVLRMTENGTTMDTWRAIKGVDRYRLIRWDEYDFHQFFSEASHGWQDLVTSCEFHGRPCEEVSTVTKSVTSQLGTCYTLRQNESATGTWTKPQLTLNLRLPGKTVYANANGPGWYVMLHPATLECGDAGLFAKNSLSHVHLPRGFLSYVRLHRRLHRHVSTLEEPCSDNITPEENARCVMKCIIEDEYLTTGRASRQKIERRRNDKPHEETAVNATTSPCHLPWQESETPNPCRTYAALQSALESSPDLSMMKEADVRAAFFSCRCPAQCTVVTYPAEVPERMPLISRFGSDGRLSAVLELWLSMHEETLQDEWSFTSSQLVAEWGGNMGIFLGASLLSIMEFLDWFVFWVIRKLTGRDRKVKDVGQTTGGNIADDPGPAVAKVNVKCANNGKMDGISYESQYGHGYGLQQLGKIAAG